MPATSGIVVTLAAAWALATVVIPWFADRYAEGADWRAKGHA